MTKIDDCPAARSVRYRYSTDSGSFVQDARQGLCDERGCEVLMVGISAWLEINRLIRFSARKAPAMVVNDNAEFWVDKRSGFSRALF